MPLTTIEQEELSQLEAEFATPGLTPDEGAELASLEAEFAQLKLQEQQDEIVRSLLKTRQINPLRLIDAVLAKF